MRTLRFECIGGASGDMILAVFADLGIDLNDVAAPIRAAAAAAFTLRIESAEEGGIHGRRVFVETPHEHHAHRGLKEIRALIANSPLPDAVKQSGILVFTRLAEAEAAVHHTTPDQVHFHEVGAVDSIVDILGACMGLHLLRVDAVVVAPFPLGHGTIECAHGILPSPAPATMKLLEGSAVVDVDEPFELVTPTAAALLTAWRSADRLPEGSRLVRTGHAFGHRKLNRRPNLLRAALFETADRPERVGDTCLVLECNIDDTVPELLGNLCQRLMEEGALDVFTTPVHMKKQRPGTLLTVLCAVDRKEALLDLVFRESTTFGVREHETRRTLLERRSIEIETPHGRVRVKIGTWNGRDVTWSPEMDDCVARAREQGVPVRQVYEGATAAVHAWRTLTNRPTGAGER